MSRTTKKFASDEPYDRAHRELSRMKHRDLQIACVLRGMEFEDVINSSDPQLAHWFLNNYERAEDQTLLPVFDEFISLELVKRGHKKGDVLLHPSLSLGYTKRDDVESWQKEDTSYDSDEDGDVKVVKKEKVKKEKKVKEKKPKKPKREKDEQLNIFKGTKKSLTYELTKQGLEFDEVLKRVTEKFPEANDKSVKIWMKRCKNMMNG